MTTETALSGLPIHHIGVAVHSITSETPTYELLTGAVSSAIEVVASQRVRVVFIGALELLEPTDSESTIARFLQRRGPGLHHIAYACRDIRGELERLINAGFQAIDTEPRPGAHGHEVAFLHPSSTGGVLVELVQPTAPGDHAGGHSMAPSS